jgi:hypothetical protein
MKNYNLEIYMHPRFYMHEHFDLSSNPFKYKCETYFKFLYVHIKIMMAAKCKS